MKTFKEDLIAIYQNERSILILIALNFLISVGLMVFAIIRLNPNAAVIRTGYSDIGGYRDGAWTGLLTFPIIAVIFGVMHSLLAVKVFHKRGGGMAKFFLITTTMLILGTILVLSRLLGEG